jgi:hypothetical protein
MKGNQVRFQFAKGIAHLSHSAERFARGFGTKVEADRVEHVASDPGQGEQQDAVVVRKAHSLLPEPSLKGAFDVGLLLLIFLVLGSRLLRIGKVVGISELQPITPVAAEEPQASIEGIQFVEVEAREEDPVLEMVCAGLQTMMHHSGLIEAGAKRSIVGGGAVSHA